MQGHIIQDGRDETAYIRERDRLHPALRFTYRPMLQGERDQINSLMNQIPAQEFHDKCVTAMRHRLKAWDAVDADKKALPCNDEAILSRLQPTLFLRVWHIICGVDSGDPDPEAEREERNDEADTQLQAALEGRPVGDARQAEAEKNS
jgi:hypothetical protein